MGELSSLRTDDFDYQLPSKFIAQDPADPRDSARLMVLDRRVGDIAHRRIPNIVDYVNPGDALVLNNTRVIRARLQCRKESGGKVELLLCRRIDGCRWLVLVRGSGVDRNSRVVIGNGVVTATILEDMGGGQRLVRFSQAIEPLLNEVGETPLPPYIKNKQLDEERYQTVYSRTLGSSASPTAGLHITPKLLDAVRYKGVHVVFVTLHIGLDTFKPVRVEWIRDHPVHTEWCCLEEPATQVINQVRNSGGRVVAVGTTTVRVLETGARLGNGRSIEPVRGDTDLFITPGFKFHAVDSLLTNFHLPRSTLLMMVAAFMGDKGRSRILAAYKDAIRSEYRFYSFGDAMLIV